VLRQRSAEVLVGTGLLSLGAFAGAAQGDPPRLLHLWIFLAGTTAFVVAVLAINSWAGYRDDSHNPRFASLRGLARDHYRQLGAASATGAALAYTWLSPWTLLLAVLALLLWTVYSTPAWGLKTRPREGAAMHAAGQLCHFYMGWLAFAPLSAASLAPAVYLSLLFVGGYLNHLVLDYAADARALSGASPPRMERDALQRVSAAVFTLAAAWLALAWLLGFVGTGLALPFLLAFAAQSGDWWLARPGGAVEAYRTRYRLYYGAAAVAWVTLVWPGMR